MASGRSFQLARVFGIRVGATPSWFIVLFAGIIWLRSSYFDDTLTGSSTAHFVGAVAAVLLYELSIVLHELGHAVTARRFGIGTSGVDLWFFGGVAKLDREADTPGREFAVAFAGPVVTLLIAGVCTIIGVTVCDPHQFADAATWRVVNTGVGTALVGLVASINVILFAFNMIPAYPLDGGRIAKAIAWKVTGDGNRGLRVAARVGQYFSYALMGFGLFLIARGDATNGIWLGVLGWFMAGSAKAAVVSSGFQERIDGVTVGDLMDTQPVWMPASTTVLQANEEFFLRYGWPWFAVADETDGTYRGVLTAERNDGALASGQPTLGVTELLDVGSEQDFSVPSNTPLVSLLGSEALRVLGALMVVDEGGHLRGVVTIEQIRRALAAAAA